MSAPRFGVPSLRIRKRRVIGVHAAVQILFPTVCGYHWRSVEYAGGL